MGQDGNGMGWHVRVGVGFESTFLTSQHLRVACDRLFENRWGKKAETRASWGKGQRDSLIYIERWDIESGWCSSVPMCF